jgi:AAA15 family ATPase/GTPase
MLLRFGVSNHRSIRDYQEIFLTASALKDEEAALLSMPPDANAALKLRGLPVVALYGANAAGKSAVIDAMDTFVAGILWSQTQTSSDRGTPHDPFLLDGASRHAASQYDADFVLGSTRYHYGFTMDAEVIVSEWLYSYALHAERQTKTVLFHRDGRESEPFYFGKSLKGDNKRITKLTRSNSLFLSAAAQNAHPVLQPIYEYFYKQVSRRMTTHEGGMAFLGEQLFNYFANDAERYKRVVNFLQAADVGIAKIDFSKVPITETKRKLLEDLDQLIAKHVRKSTSLAEKSEETKVEILHVGEGGQYFPIALDEESSGTRALMQLLGPVFNRLQDGGVLIIDELNVALHPLVSRELVGLFSNPQTNPAKAQLIFSTHDTSILTAGLLRRDQIWFAEKDNFGATCVYPLSSIKVRATDNWERGYITGRFGAIPFLGANLLSRQKTLGEVALDEKLKAQGLDEKIAQALSKIGEVPTVALDGLK